MIFFVTCTYEFLFIILIYFVDVNDDEERRVKNRKKGKRGYKFFNVES